jgi:Holliday junction resolvasome RuvABC endonuclease subunit
MKKVVLGIDPGTQTGWALCQDGQIINSGVISFDKIASKGYGAMFAAFRHWLRDFHTDYKLLAIAYELPFHRGAITSRITGGMAAHIMERAYTWRCKSLAVQTLSLKKFATGSGKSDKIMMIAAAKKYIQGDREISEHEADAVHIAMFAYASLKGEKFVR